ncbi:MAG TPA: hypothetical protein VD735_01835 [Candidatus Saccharimonadales bacterium]|nr:hypothetical protein [Candidatus Saccharimonadales bacterium]
MSIFPDEPSAEEQLDQLPNDGTTPFRPADDIGDDGADDTHQVTDTNLDPHEIYDEGYAGAAEASEPNAGNAVVGYDATKDQRRTTVSDDDKQDAA